MDTTQLDWSLEGYQIFGWTKPTNTARGKAKFGIDVHAMIGSGVSREETEQVATLLHAALTASAAPAAGAAAAAAETGGAA